MGLPKSIRLDEAVEEKVEAYLEQNPINFARLVNLAVEKYISEPQSIELRPVNDEEFESIAKKAFKKHRHAMNKLK